MMGKRRSWIESFAVFPEGTNGGQLDSFARRPLWDAGLDYAEIAKQTGLATGAIGTTLARARKRLVELYADAEERDVARG